MSSHNLPTAGDTLPIHEVLEEVRETLATNDTLIVNAAPGAGKTTVLPLALLQAPWLADQRIILLQPRRIATRTVAQRMASALGEQVGQTVGYRMRHESRVSDKTRLEVITDGVLLRMLSEDPELSGVGLLIFDEFHERSLIADTGLALATYSRSTFERQPPVKILVMSATLDDVSIAKYLDAPSVTAPGRQFPVSTVYPGAAGSRPLDEYTAQIAAQAAQQHPAQDVLVFLPGRGDIHRVEQRLRATTRAAVVPLHGGLSVADQQRAIEPMTGRQKIVLATNIAETSLTINGIGVVVDTGLERRSEYDPKTGISRLRTGPISQASAEQRRGRAGRLGPGHCYRLWSADTDHLRQTHSRPEIENAELTSTVLQLFDWGIDDPEELNWITSPPAASFGQAVALLVSLGAISINGGCHNLTHQGRAMARIPTHPRLASMLLRATSQQGALLMAATLAAVISDTPSALRDEPDVSVALDYLRYPETCPSHLARWRSRVRQLADRLMASVSAAPGGEFPLDRLSEDQWAGYLLATAFPDRIAMQRGHNRFKLANGRTAVFLTDTPLASKHWLVVSQVDGTAQQSQDVIRQACAVDPSLFDNALADLCTTQTTVEWQRQSGRFIAEERTVLGDLPISTRPLSNISDDIRIASLCRALADNAWQDLPWNEDSENFRARANLMADLDSQWPDFSDQGLTADADVWLAPFLTEVTQLSYLRRLNLVQALKLRLSYAQAQALDSHLPTHIDVPSGRRVKIDYRQRPPVLAVKLQEMFGCQTSPQLASGRVPLSLHLLSPAGRPLQVTSDLASFWANGYAQVRKENRGRYPKHPWPENPLEAQATSRTKPRGTGR